jgi:hypothetical protein
MWGMPTCKGTAFSTPCDLWIVTTSFWALSANRHRFISKIRMRLAAGSAPVAMNHSTKARTSQYKAIAYNKGVLPTHLS